MPKQPTDRFDEFSGILSALAHPVRLRMLAGLCRTECNVGSLWKELGISQPLASQHLKRLQQAGLIVGRRRGQEICYSIVNPQVAAWLRQMPDLFQRGPASGRKKGGAEHE